MNFAEQIIRFFYSLDPPENLPEEVELLWPYGNAEVRRIIKTFYTRYFSSKQKRIFLVGINPGRFGAGVTGINFTDPNRLSEDCGIGHQLKPGKELSSDFVYRMIKAWGGVESFYSHFYLGALSPAGFMRDGKNLNYYDIKGLPQQLDAWMAQAMTEQIKAGADRRVAFSMGMGKNFKYMCEFNERHGFFRKVEALPHPRWIMQYRRKRLDEFIELYVRTLKEAARTA